MTIYLLVGWYVGRKIKSLDDYYVAGRNSPTLLIIGTLVASFMSTNAYIGELGMSYTGHAPLIIIMTAGNCLGYLVGGLFFGRYLRRSKALTVPEFFGARFNSQRLQQFAGITILVGLTCYLLAVTWGVALIVSEVAQINYSTSIIFVWFRLLYVLSVSFCFVFVLSLRAEIINPTGAKKGGRPVSFVFFKNSDLPVCKIDD